MSFIPYEFIPFHSHVLTIEPCDICTSALGAAVIRKDDFSVWNRRLPTID
jgi:hypothetical protein